MKQVLAICLCCIPIFSIAQNKRDKSVKDSLRYYETKLMNLRKAYWDTIRNSQDYKEAMDNIKRLRGNSTTISGVIFSGQCMHTNYDDFNKSIAADGFPAMQETSLRLGLGFFLKEKRQVFEFYFGNFGIGVKSKKGEEKIKASLSNVFQVNYGYDLLNSKRISIYPFAGLSIRMAYLRYTKPVVTNPNFTNITNIVVTEQSFDAASTTLGYQAGLNLDINLVTASVNRSGLGLFVRGGVDRPLWKDKYKIYDYKYDPRIKHGDWLVGFGIKLFGLSN